MAHRPEHTGPPELYYNSSEARKYTQSSRMIEVQLRLTERAVELLRLPPESPQLLLDLGCGSGLSGEFLTEQGHQWIGLDISPAMLEVARERDTEGGLLLGDMGDGLPFRAGVFDGAISVSALQWLCNADKKCHDPVRRLSQLFTSLYAVLRRGARAVFQLYPENAAQMELITFHATKAGFSGGLVVDYPNSSKAKKLFLCLFTGGAPVHMPAPLGVTSAPQVSFSERKSVRGRTDHRTMYKSKDWIISKKERRRRQGGKFVRPDTKYTGRRRKGKF